MAASITFHRLSDVASEDWVRLLNDPDVRRHMPLARGEWQEGEARGWAEGKDAQWEANGYGPWAIRIDEAFAGWGGFQQEGDEADLGLVLLPGFWGHGSRIFAELVRRGREMKLGKVAILLPPSRVRLKGLVRLGFEPSGEVEYDGQRFLKFRLVG